MFDQVDKLIAIMNCVDDHRHSTIQCGRILKIEVDFSFEIQWNFSPT